MKDANEQVRISSADSLKSTLYLGPDGGWIIWSDRAPTYADEAHRSMWYEIGRLRAEVHEWLCDKCNTVYPGKPHPKSLVNVFCEKCGGVCAPRLTIEKHRLEASLELSRKRISELEKMRDSQDRRITDLSYQAYPARNASGE